MLEWMCRCISDGKKHIKTQQLHSSARMALSLQDKDLVQTHLGPQMRGSSLYKVDTKWEQSTLCWRTAEAIFYCCIVFSLLNVHTLQRLMHFTLWIWWEMKREETVKTDGVIGNMGTTYKRQRERWNWDIENHWRSMERQSGSKKGNVKT